MTVKEGSRQTIYLIKSSTIASFARGLSYKRVKRRPDYSVLKLSDLSKIQGGRYTTD